jgi:hypothetical protein
LAAPFLNEKIDFDLTFMGAKLAAGAITFVRSSTWAYTATIDARITGAVSPLINLRQQTMTARMIVQNIAGHDRFVTGTFTRHTVTADKTIDRVHEFNYFHRRWIYTYTENGRRPRTERRRIAPNVFYDDFANILYNTRAQVYAPFGSGQVAVVHTIPWTKTVKQDNGAKKKVRADSLTLVFPKPADYSAEERDWMKDHKADTLIVAKLDRDVYEIKAGEAKFIGDKNGKPIAAWIKDALLYGDVRATARR